GVVVARQEVLGVPAGCTRVEGPGFAQSLVGQLAPRAPRVLAEDAGHALPEGPGFLRLTRLCQQTPNGIEHCFKLRPAETSRRDVAQRRHATSLVHDSVRRFRLTILRDGSRLTPFA